MTLTPNLRGATYMMASMAAFSLSDACVKFVVEDLPDGFSSWNFDNPFDAGDHAWHGRSGFSHSAW